MSPETEEKGSLSGCCDPPGDLVTWWDEKALGLVTGVRRATPHSDSGEETLQPFRSRLSSPSVELTLS